MKPAFRGQQRVDVTLILKWMLRTRQSENQNAVQIRERAKHPETLLNRVSDGSAIGVYARVDQRQPTYPAANCERKAIDPGHQANSCLACQSKVMGFRETMGVP